MTELRPRPYEDLTALTPGLLRSLNEADLTDLAAEIRRYLVATLSETGGHLGPNLGAVELTLALHRVFDSPDDALLWDTGHQAYVHKMVTGRGEEFPTLRQPGGLSGYPNRSESSHDHIENSHASTALSYAYGFARARQLRRDRRRVVAVVGDGALTGGLAYEGLSNIGVAGLPVIVVLNDNGRSYAPTVSRLTTAMGSSGAPSEDRSADPSAFFGAMGFRYLGPVDGHDVAAMEESLRDAATTSGPVVVHVHTRKGEGYVHAESDPEKRLHDVPPFDAATGRARSNGIASRGFTEVFSRAIVDEGARRPELVAITAAMPGSTGLLEFAQRYPERFFDVGIAEQHAVAAAAGMAMDGLRPVVAIYSTFLNRAWDQIVHDVALHGLPVVFCVDRAGVTGDDGPSHHGIFDLALLTKVPGMTVLAPSCAEEVGEMLATVLDHCDGPAVIRWPKTASPPRVGDPVAGAGAGLRARRLRTGDDVCLLGVGKLAHACDESAALLSRLGIEAEAWDVRVAAPLDRAMLESARRHRVVVVAEDGVADGGVGDRVAAELGGRLVRRVEGHQTPAAPTGGPLAAATPGTADGAPLVVACGLPIAFLAHGRAGQILSEHGLDAAGLARSAQCALEMAGPGTARVRRLEVPLAVTG